MYFKRRRKEKKSNNNEQICFLSAMGKKAARTNHYYLFALKYIEIYISGTEVCEFVCKRKGERRGQSKKATEITKTRTHSDFVGQFDFILFYFFHQCPYMRKRWLYVLYIHPNDEHFRIPFVRSFIGWFISVAVIVVLFGKTMRMYAIFAVWPFECRMSFVSRVLARIRKIAFNNVNVHSIFLTLLVPFPLSVSDQY